MKNKILTVAILIMCACNKYDPILNEHMAASQLIMNQAPLETSACQGIENKNNPAVGGVNPYYPLEWTTDMLHQIPNAKVVVRGDSIGYYGRTVPGLYGPDTQVFNVWGNTICAMIREDAANVVKTTDNVVFWTMGMNNLGLKVLSTAQEISEMQDMMIQQTRSRYPNAKIVFVGIHIFDSAPFQEALRVEVNNNAKAKMASISNGCFVDVNSTITDVATQTTDGKHLTAASLSALKIQIFQQCGVAL